MLSMSHVAGPQFALPALLYRNIATTDLYNADWRIVGASITFKALTGVGFMAYAYATRGKHGPAAERMLVSHSILTFPNLGASFLQEHRTDVCMLTPDGPFPPVQLSSACLCYPPCFRPPLSKSSLACCSWYGIYAPTLTLTLLTSDHWRPS
jgi:hypothetical protein